MEKGIWGGLMGGQVGKGSNVGGNGCVWGMWVDGEFVGEVSCVCVCGVCLVQKHYQRESVSLWKPPCPNYS